MSERPRAAQGSSFLIYEIAGLYQASVYAASV